MLKTKVIGLSFTLLVPNTSCVTGFSNEFQPSHLLSTFDQIIQKMWLPTVATCTVPWKVKVKDLFHFCRPIWHMTDAMIVSFFKFIVIIWLGLCLCVATKWLLAHLYTHTNLMKLCSTCDVYSSIVIILYLSFTVSTIFSWHVFSLHVWLGDFTANTQCQGCELWPNLRYARSARWQGVIVFIVSWCQFFFLTM